MVYQWFVNTPNSLIIAPAGYGKTYTIAESLKYVDGKHLILTHTHAGIAAIKDKIKNTSVPKDKYIVETICGFAQKYTTAFYANPENVPEQESKDYHEFQITKATEIIKHNTVQKVIKRSYTGIIVDEYQDCTKQQHELILALSKILPTHILGDHMQGIFDFNNNVLVDFASDLSNFNCKELDVPYRWKNAGKVDLGNKLKQIRSQLENENKLDLADYSDNIDIIVHIATQNDIFDVKSEYIKLLRKIVANSDNSPELESLLIIVPSNAEQGQISQRVKIKNLIDFDNSLHLVEAIDGEQFYKIARKIDSLMLVINRAKKKRIRIKKDVLDFLFQSTGLHNWFNDEDVVSRKKSETDGIKLKYLTGILDKFILNPSVTIIKDLIEFVSKELRIKYIRNELYYSTLTALKLAICDRITVYNAMKNHRNMIRRVGRRIEGKCIGTTLLTKGLEFDTVVILGAHLFDSPKHLYVALTRCSKKLIIFTEKTTLSYIY